jgi:hypothetical protein
MMSSQWIKVDPSYYPTDGRLLDVSRRCHVKLVTAFGALVAIWGLADSQADEQGVLHGYTKADIDRYVDVPGFCEALPKCWIDLSGEWVKLPNYQVHNGTTAKSRALAAKRQQRHRAVTPKSRVGRDISVTRTRERRRDIATPPFPPKGGMTRTENAAPNPARRGNGNGSQYGINRPSAVDRVRIANAQSEQLEDAERSPDDTANQAG